MEPLSRRTLLHASWLTPVAHVLGRADEKKAPAQARSVILLWLAGGPSQLETFDPHAGTLIAAGTAAIKTSVKGIELAAGLPRLAEAMEDVTLIRSVVSEEGDHERATYNMKTGYRPDPTVVHPSIGAVICHELPDTAVEIPRHISILPGQWPSRGGYLGAGLDAFKVYDPRGRVPDMRSPVPDARRSRRLKGLDVVEGAFARGRRPDLDTRSTLPRVTIQKALRMMGSEQLDAFDISKVPARQRAAFGDTPFGRGCLVAMRLIETGVRCIEVTLGGWDTHFNNHEAHAKLNAILDPAFTALVAALKERGLLERTVVLCGGEFGRTPNLNPFEGRDHWPHAFSLAVAGGGFRRGTLYGGTDPSGKEKEPDKPVRVADIHTTVMHALGIDSDKEIQTPVGRPMALSDGKVIGELLTGD